MELQIRHFLQKIALIAIFCICIPLLAVAKNKAGIEISKTEIRNVVLFFFGFSPFMAIAMIMFKGMIYENSKLKDDVLIKIIFVLLRAAILAIPTAAILIRNYHNIKIPEFIDSFKGLLAISFLTALIVTSLGYVVLKYPKHWNIDIRFIFLPCLVGIAAIPVSAMFFSWSFVLSIAIVLVYMTLILALMEHNPKAKNDSFLLALIPSWCLLVFMFYLIT